MGLPCEFPNNLWTLVTMSCSFHSFLPWGAWLMVRFLGVGSSSTQMKHLCPELTQDLQETVMAEYLPSLCPPSLSSFNLSLISVFSLFFLSLSPFLLSLFFFFHSFLFFFSHSLQFLIFYSLFPCHSSPISVSSLSLFLSLHLNIEKDFFRNWVTCLWSLVKPFYWLDWSQIQRFVIVKTTAWDLQDFF